MPESKYPWECDLRTSEHLLLRDASRLSVVPPPLGHLGGLLCWWARDATASGVTVPASVDVQMFAYKWAAAYRVHSISGIGMNEVKTQRERALFNCAPADWKDV